MDGVSAAYMHNINSPLGASSSAAGPGEVFAERSISATLMVSDTTASCTPHPGVDEASYVELSMPTQQSLIVPHYFPPSMRTLSADFLGSSSDLVSLDTASERFHQRDRERRVEKEDRRRLGHSEFAERRVLLTSYTKELFMLERSALLQDYFVSRASCLLQITVHEERARRKQLVRDCARGLRSLYDVLMSEADTIAEREKRQREST